MVHSLLRRSFLRVAAAAPVAGLIQPAGFAIAAPFTKDIRIADVWTEYEDFKYRAPLKFGGNIVDRVTLLNVHCVVKGAAGQEAKGFGSMPMGNIWSFPSQTMGYEKTLGAMKALASRIEAATRAYQEPGHPVDINVALESVCLKLAEEVSKEQQLDAPIPKLCTLVTASPFDIALHDAYGKLHGLSCWKTYGKDFLRNDLSSYLGADFKGEHLDRYVQEEPKAEMPLYHLVGAVDPILPTDIRKRLNDGLPETLPEWIQYNGLTHLKIKLNGDDLNWDVQRVLKVNQVAEVQDARDARNWVYSLDFNEKCKNVEYLLEFLRQVKEKSPAAFARIQYVEQPTARDLKLHRENVMRKAAALRPVVIDESLIDLESLLLAREMGYSGVALKVCKGQSQSLLMAAAAQKYRMFLCVQDLTCPGASLLESASLSAHIPGVAAVEANARQYVPAANAGWDKKFPGIFNVRNGTMRTAELTGLGMGAVA
jgi:L-alanine-DL-glutamate epimerase-like enolase superfamily enzyme